MREVKILQNISEISRVAAEKFITIGGEAINQNGKFTVALAGGSTPKSLYQLLTTENFKNQIDWRKVFFFLGDERNVLPDDEESNFRMANDNLLKPLQIPKNQIFRWQTEIEDAEKIARDYEETIKEFFGLKDKPLAVTGISELLPPRFDLILLGIGNDGHTASLFPFTNALQENGKIAVANWVETLRTTRLTFTFRIINNAANVIFLVSGESKATVLREILEDEFQPDKVPSQNVRLTKGNLIWLIDRQAAQFLINREF
ncbi:MAG: 6-phosphogluconolactonase [Pyrinomonadaceae bacterium]